MEDYFSAKITPASTTIFVENNSQEASLLRQEDLFRLSHPTATIVFEAILASCETLIAGSGCPALYGAVQCFGPGRASLAEKIEDDSATP